MFKFFRKKKPETLRYFLTGFGMGAADLVPGVSGGTIAFIFGIYEKLIDSIKLLSGDVLKLFLQGKFKKAWSMIPFSFLLPLAAGLGFALVSLSSLLHYLLHDHPVAIWSFFFGLVLTSIFLVAKRVKNWKPTVVVLTALSSIGAFLLVGAVPVETASSLPAFFVAGFFAIIAMILPGISGSFLLVIMGKYEQVLTAIKDFDFAIIAIVGIGAVLGLALFSRLLSYLFDKYHDLLIGILTGFMIGSLRKIWPFREAVATRINSEGLEEVIQDKAVLPMVFDSSVVMAVILVGLGAYLMYVLEKQQQVTEEE